MILSGRRDPEQLIDVAKQSLSLLPDDGGSQRHFGRNGVLLIPLIVFMTDIAYGMCRCRGPLLLEDDKSTMT